MQRRSATIVALVLMLTAAPSSNAHGIGTAGALAKSCRAVERGATGTGEQIRIPNTKNALLCWGYMQAIQDLSVLVDQSGNRLLGVCPPEDTTSIQLLNSFTRYARAHPDELQGNPAVVMIHALHEAFPCKISERSD